MGVPGEDSAPALFEFGTAFLKQEVLGRLDLADRASLLETCRSGRDLVKDADWTPHQRAAAAGFSGQWSDWRGRETTAARWTSQSVLPSLCMVSWTCEVGSGACPDALTTAAAAKAGTRRARMGEEKDAPGC